MNRLIKNISLLAVLPIFLTLTSCGGGGGGNNSTSGNNVNINGTTYTENGSAVHVEGFINQTSQYGYQMGGPTVVITMDDTQSGNSLSFSIPTTNHGFPGTYNLFAFSGPNSAYITDKTVATGGNMLVGGTGTGGAITISHSSSPVGKPLVGSFNLDLCDLNAVCSNSIKKYTGTFSVNLTSNNLGSIAMPSGISFSAPATPVSYYEGVAPTTGKNYYFVPANATGGALTLTLIPSAPNGDVNMAVFTDAGFATPATCDVASNLSVVGGGVETCGITVAANQQIYFTVSQTNTATFMETYTLNAVEN